MEENLCVEGHRDAWLGRIKQGLEANGFTRVTANSVLYQVTADYKKFTVWGEIVITLIPAAGNADGQTYILLKSTANVDNIYALFKSPNKAILHAAKAGLSKR